MPAGSRVSIDQGFELISFFCHKSRLDPKSSHVSVGSIYEKSNADGVFSISLPEATAAKHSTFASSTVSTTGRGRPSQTGSYLRKESVHLEQISGNKPKTSRLKSHPVFVVTRSCNQLGGEDSVLNPSSRHTSSSRYPTASKAPDRQRGRQPYIIPWFHGGFPLCRTQNYKLY